MSVEYSTESFIALLLEWDEVPGENYDITVGIPAEGVTLPLLEDYDQTTYLDVVEPGVERIYTVTSTSTSNVQTLTVTPTLPTGGTAPAARKKAIIYINAT